jgi:hypothetical protein
MLRAYFDGKKPPRPAGNKPNTADDDSEDEAVPQPAAPKPLTQGNTAND